MNIKISDVHKIDQITFGTFACYLCSLVHSEVPNRTPLYCLPVASVFTIRLAGVAVVGHVFWHHLNGILEVPSVLEVKSELWVSSDCDCCVDSSSNCDNDWRQYSL